MSQSQGCVSALPCSVKVMSLTEQNAADLHSVVKVPQQ
jgi:hypothetical protein